MNDIVRRINKFIDEEGIVTGDVEQNFAKGHVPVIGMKYKKKKRKNRLTGSTVVHEKDGECKDGYYWCDVKEKCVKK